MAYFHELTLCLMMVEKWNTADHCICASEIACSGLWWLPFYSCVKYLSVLEKKKKEPESPESAEFSDWPDCRHTEIDMSACCCLHLHLHSQIWHLADALVQSNLHIYLQIRNQAWWLKGAICKKSWFFSLIPSLANMIMIMMNMINRDCRLGILKWLMCSKINFSCKKLQFRCNC